MQTSVGGLRRAAVLKGTHDDGHRLVAHGHQPTSAFPEHDLNASGLSEPGGKAGVEVMSIDAPGCWERTRAPAATTHPWP